MKSQKFTEQQLKDLVAGKQVQTVEAKKKGEYPHLSLYEKIMNGERQIKGIVLAKVDKKTGKPIQVQTPKKLCEMYEIAQATNEEGEKIVSVNKIDSIGFDSEKKAFIGEGKLEPLFVRLEKIEETKLNRVRKKPLSFKVKEGNSLPPNPYVIVKDIWLKTWVRK
jgi:hypothetical protein